MTIKKSALRLLLLAAMATLSSTPVLAITHTLKLEFKPQPGQNPDKFTYINDCSGQFCNVLKPHVTEGHIDSWVQAFKDIKPYSTDTNDHFVFKIPAERDVTVSAPNGHTLTVKLRFTGGLTRHAQVSGQISPSALLSNDYPKGPCVFSGSAFSSNWKAWMFKFNGQAITNGGTCIFNNFKTGLPDTVKTQHAALGLLYSLTTPGPLEFESTIYRGQVRYTMGPDGDFSFGNVTTQNDRQAIFNLELHVRHLFHFRFSPDANQVSLKPADNWYNWHATSAVPDAIAGSAPFIFSSVNPMVMYLQCEHQSGNNCAIRHSSGHTAPVGVTVDMPGMRRADSMQAIINTPLQAGSANAISVRPISTVHGSNGALNFRVEKPALEQMLQHEGERYRGDITLMVEATLN